MSGNFQYDDLECFDNPKTHQFRNRVQANIHLGTIDEGVLSDLSLD